MSTAKNTNHGVLFSNRTNWKPESRQSDKVFRRCSLIPRVGPGLHGTRWLWSSRCLVSIPDSRLKEGIERGLLFPFLETSHTILLSKSQFSYLAAYSYKISWRKSFF